MNPRLRRAAAVTHLGVALLGVIFHVVARGAKARAVAGIAIRVRGSACRR